VLATGFLDIESVLVWRVHKIHENRERWRRRGARTGRSILHDPGDERTQELIS